MKSQTLVNWVLLTLLLFGTLNVSANGDDEVMFGNWENPMSGQLNRFNNHVTMVLFPNGTLRVNLYITTATKQEDVINASPPIYLNYQFGAFAGQLGPVDHNRLKEVTLENGGETAFRQRFPLEFDFSNECAINELFEIGISFDMVTPNQMGDMLYPISQHLELFPPGMFRESTFPYPPPSYSDTKTIDCVGLTADLRLKDSNESDLTELDLSLQSLSPNPFNEQFKLVYHLASASQVRVELRDLSGKLFFDKQSLLQREGLHEETIYLRDLPPGLWLLRLSTAESIQTVKLVKH